VYSIIPPWPSSFALPLALPPLMVHLFPSCPVFLNSKLHIW
jgi:hypothetical protein